MTNAAGVLYKVTISPLRGSDVSASRRLFRGFLNFCVCRTQRQAPAKAACHGRMCLGLRNLISPPGSRISSGNFSHIERTHSMKHVAAKPRKSSTFIGRTSHSPSQGIGGSDRCVIQTPTSSGPSAKDTHAAPHHAGLRPLHQG